jgi:hypothetical protein
MNPERENTVSLDWWTHRAALDEYAREYGHCNVPGKFQYECILHGVSDGNNEDTPYKANLGLWLSRQRASKLGSSKTTLSSDKLASLQELVDKGI